MAGEIQFSWKADSNAYVLVRNKIGQVWNVSSGAFDTYLTASYASFVISATEQGDSSAYYVSSFPPTAPPGSYSITGKGKIGVSEAETDPTVAAGNLEWNGSSVAQLADTVSSGDFSRFLPVRIAKGEAVNNFLFKLVSATDHCTSFTSGNVSGQISKNGGVFGPLQSGNVSEVGLGWYRVNLTSGDLSANTIALVFNANGISGGGSDQRDFAFICQRVSGG